MPEKQNFHVGASVLARAVSRKCLMSGQTRLRVPHSFAFCAKGWELPKQSMDARAYTTEAVALSRSRIKAGSLEIIRAINMASAKQKTAAKKNISKAATAAKKKRTISHLLLPQPARKEKPRFIRQQCGSITATVVPPFQRRLVIISGVATVSSVAGG